MTWIVGGGMAGGAIVGGVDCNIGVDRLEKTTALTGVADTKLGHEWMILNIPSTLGTQTRVVQFASDRFIVNIPLSGNKISVAAKNAAGTLILNATMALDAPEDVWFGLAISYDMTDINKFQMYQVTAAGVWSDLGLTPSTFVNDSIEYSVSGTPKLMTQSSTPIGQSMGVAELVVNNVAWLDWSLSANQLKVHDGDKFVSLFPDAKVLTATAPIIYQGRSFAQPNEFATNKGSGGDFTIIGTLTNSATSP